MSQDTAERAAEEILAAFDRYQSTLGEYRRRKNQQIFDAAIAEILAKRDPRTDPMVGDVVEIKLWTAVWAKREVIEVTPTHVTFVGYYNGTEKISRWKLRCSEARVVKRAE